MSELDPNGWTTSAAAWIAAIGREGDDSRRFILDAPMMARVEGRGFSTALDVGCGEGRFCRMLQAKGVRTTGIDPTEALIRRARDLDPQGDYRIGRAERLNEAGGPFDLVVSYLTLVDIPDIRTAIAQMAAVLRPGGTLLIANLTSFNTAGLPRGWAPDETGMPAFRIDRYLEERAVWVEWRGIRVQNWHRPLGTYMTLLLENGLELRSFAEPEPTSDDPAGNDRYRRVPFFHIMEWQKRG